MTPEKFRRQLQKESQLWLREGLIDDNLYEQLSQRYQFNLIETVSRDRFILILISLGGILLGLGVITFVAANWQNWSQLVKTIILFLIFVASNLAGFYLWQDRPHTTNTITTRQRFGQGLLFFASLLLGANIANIAQTFHLGGSDYELYLVWGLGVLTMAYGLRLTSLGILAITLMEIGYWLGIMNISWWGEVSLLELIIQHFALVATLLFLPLAYWCNSGVIFVLTCLMVMLAFTISGNRFFYTLSPQPLSFALTPALAIALLWGYNDSLLPYVHSKQFQPLARSLAIWFLSIIFFLLSFKAIWWESITSNTTAQNISILVWLILLDLVLLTAWMIREWWYLLNTNKRNSSQNYLDLSSLIITLFIFISLLIIYFHFSVNSIAILAIFIFNLQLFILAIGLVKRGLARANRLTFWGGMILLILQIISRTFEYETGLIAKSLVFLLCGISVIFIGLWFERNVKIINS